MTIEPTNVSEGLEPCPFPHEVKRGPFIERDTEDFFIVRVSCGDCGCAGPYVPIDSEKGGAEKVEAIRLWNTRATLSPPLPSPGVERLREALEIFAESADDIERAYGSSVPDDQYQFPPLRMSDFRRARSALSALPLDGGDAK